LNKSYNRGGRGGKLRNGRGLVPCRFPHPTSSKTKKKEKAKSINTKDESRKKKKGPGEHPRRAGKGVKRGGR